MRLLLANFFQFLIIFVFLFKSGCSHEKPKTTPELSKLEGKKVALVEIEGEHTAQTIVEVALVNQLLETGTFTLISKKEVEAARTTFDQNPTDLLGIARKSGADYALQVKVLEMAADTREGYSAQEIEDTQLRAERGDEANKATRLYKVKALSGKVRVELSFTALADNDVRKAVAEEEQEMTVDSSQGAIHLPPKIRFLEKLANSAFKKFFENYR